MIVEPEVYTAICYQPNGNSYRDRSGYCSNYFDSRCLVVTDTVQDRFVAEVVKRMDKQYHPEEPHPEVVILFDGIAPMDGYNDRIDLCDLRDVDDVDDSEEELALATAIHQRIMDGFKAAQKVRHDARAEAEKAEQQRLQQAARRADLATLAKLREKYPEADQ